MTTAYTGSYDAYLAITGGGLERLFRAGFLEAWASYGLPAEYVDLITVDLGSFVPGLQLTGVLHARLGLPQVTVPSATFVPVPAGAATTSILPTAVDITLPFEDTALVVDALPVASKYCLNGILVVVLPVIDASGVLRFDFANLFVRIVPSTTDPDPHSGGNTSAVKLAGLVGTMEQGLTNQFRTSPPPGLATLADNPGVGFLFGHDTCGVGSSAMASDAPVLQAPTGFACIDPEPPTATPALPPDDEPLTLLFAKAKISQRAVDEGTQGDSALGDKTWLRTGAELALMLSNRFVLDEIIASQLIRGLLEEQLEGVARSEVPDIVADYFKYPIEQLKPIPRTFPLPTVAAFAANPQDPFPEEPPEEPNGFITRVRVSLTDDDNSAIRIRVNASGAELGYTFKAVVTVDVVLTHRHGRLQIQQFPHEPDVSVDFEPWVYLAAAAIGFLSPVIGGVILAPLLVLIADMAIDPVASEQVGGQLGLPDVDAGIGDLFGATLLTRVVLDDLAVSGDFRIGHDADGVGLDAGAAVVEQACIADEKVDSFETGETYTVTHDGLDLLVVTAETVTPLNGTALLNLGVEPLFLARNRSQADLRAAAAEFAGATVSIGDVTGSIEDEPEDAPTAAVALHTAAGQYGLLLISRAPAGVVSTHHWLYRQILPGLHMTLWPPGPVDVDEVADFIYSGELKHGDRAYSASSCEQVYQNAEHIDMPFGVPIKVGWSESECSLEATAVATPVLLRQPLSGIDWVAVRSDGTEQLIPAGAPVVVDVGTGSEAASVTFLVDAESDQLCHVASEPGVDLDFSLVARLTEKYDIDVEGAIDIRLDGARVDVFGYDRWLEQFEKLRAFMHGPGDDGIGPDPLPIDRAGAGTVRPADAYLARFAYLSRRIDLPAPGLTAEAFLRDSDDGTRGIRGRDVQRKPLYELTAAPPPSSPGRRDVLSGPRAKAYLRDVVKSAFAELRERGATVDLAAYERRITASVDALPEPKTLLAQAGERCRQSKR